MGRTLLKKGLSPNPTPKTFIAFSAQDVCDILHRKSSESSGGEIKRKHFQEVTSNIYQTYDDNSDLPQYPCIAVGDILLEKSFPQTLLLNFYTFSVIGRRGSRLPKIYKRFRKGVWGITLLQKGFPQLPRRDAAVYLRFTHFTGFIIGAIGTGFSAAEAACIVHGVV